MAKVLLNTRRMALLTVAVKAILKAAEQPHTTKRQVIDLVRDLEQSLQQAKHDAKRETADV